MKKVLLLSLSLLLCTGTFIGIIAFFSYTEPSILNLGIISVISTLGFICSYAIFDSSRAELVVKPKETPQQKRLRWYKIALEEILADRESFVCCAIHNNCVDFRLLYKLNSFLLPELYARRTEPASCIWFNNKKERIDALKACIEELS